VERTEGWRRRSSPARKAVRMTTTSTIPLTTLSRDHQEIRTSRSIGRSEDVRRRPLSTMPPRAPCLPFAPGTSARPADSCRAGPSLTGPHWRPSDSNRSLSTSEPVSVPAREVRREKVRRGQRPRRHFWRHRPISGRQRPCYPASAAAKPRKVKDYSDRGRKPDLRGTAWWGW
jgi:hypothetical protein